ncbi:MAG: endo-1,4-beta-xylanase [Fibrobacter sp.]|uniref:endo-1,4-beta-xylanase n=1 Tax=Fibrobacter sp. TaxID=35828 RepID=UPI001B01C9A4|nr:endo-1,4-beta-xylanase [Fibrobacter sp.]MBO7061371.1 endo-1,4-beta-xylanase [Fibrobacter sp.]
MTCRILKLAVCTLSCAFSGVFAGPGLADGAAKFLGNIPVDGEVPADFAKYWNQISPDRECVWAQVEKDRGNYDFTKCDAIYNWAKQNGVLFKFRTLVWGSQYPGWIRNLNVEETRDAITAWFDAVAEHYPDLEMIDVVTEAGRASENQYHSAFGVNNHFIEALGGDNDGDYKFVTTAFKMARERWPKAILIYNDYNTFQWQRDVGIKLINTIKKNGAPVDGYGLQGHDLMATGSGPTNCLNFNMLKRYLQEIIDSTQIPLYITEYDIGTTDDDIQKKCYSEQIPLFMEEDRIAGITLWGYIYGKTWASCNAKELGCSGIIRDGEDRPAMTWLKEYFAEHKADTKNKWISTSEFPGEKPTGTGNKDSTIQNPPLAISNACHLQANTLQAYDVFDLNGVRLGRLRAYTMDEAVLTLQNTSDIKVQGVYMLRSVKNGTVKSVRIAR